MIPAGRYSYDESFLLFRTNPAARLSASVGRVSPRPMNPRNRAAPI